MSLMIDFKTNFAEFVIDVGKVVLGTTQRAEMNPQLRMKQNENILQAICALLNSGGGVIKAEIENKDYNHEIHGLGLDLPPDFVGYLDEMQQGDLFFMFVKSWNTEFSDARLATLCSNLYYRYDTSTSVMGSREAVDFLKDRTETFVNIYDPNLLGPQEDQVGALYEDNIEACAAALFDRKQLQYLEKLNIPVSKHVEFQMFPADLSQCVKERLPRCVSAFANTEGGYVFFGVHDETRQVIGYEKEKLNPSVFKNSVENCIRKLPVHHFCTQKHKIQYAIRFLEVHDKGTLYGYVCAVKVERFCCVVFAKVPSSWHVEEDKDVKQLTPKEWVEWMMEASPDLSRVSEMVLELHLSPSMPRSRTVCSHKNVERLKELQHRCFPVLSSRVVYTPESIYKELFSQYKGLRDLINREMRPVSQGILIFSRSWAVDVGLKRNQGVICDALLISQNNTPILYTVFSKWDVDSRDYSMKLAHSLKQRLVDTGGYTGKLCIAPLVFLLSPDETSKTPHCSEVQIYPESYNLTTTQNMEALLQSLVIVLFGFRSFENDKIWNLLTDQQYELLSKDLHKTRKLFVRGLPGSGKTIVALRIIEKIRNVFHCKPENILYVCEKQPLKTFVSQKNLCQAVTRKIFMKYDYAEVQHIIVDEAQNFRTEDGDWYKKAKAITQKREGGPGILWIFLDYFQINHLSCSGLPALSDQFPREELTRVVRNADKIVHYLQIVMQHVRENPPPNIPPGSLVTFCEPDWGQGVPGSVEIIESLGLEEVLLYIAEQCQLLRRSGYSPRDIAVLITKATEIEKYKDKLVMAMRKRKMSQLDEELDPFVQVRDALDIQTNNIVLDSVHRFSGLERNVVFGIIPEAIEPAIFYNLLFCLASRAKKHLYILKVPV